MNPRLRTWVRAQWDRVGAWTAFIVGAVALYIGWKGAANTPYPADQIAYVISGGIGGALLVAFGAVLLISADLRDEWQQLDDIASDVRRIADALTTDVEPAEHASGNGSIPRETSASRKRSSSARTARR